MNSRAIKWIYWFDEIGLADIPRVGGKNASLGEMYRELTKGGVKVPFGFAISVEAYRHFLSENHLEDKLRRIFSDLDVKSVENLQRRGLEARQAILAATMPQDLSAEIISAYGKLGGEKKGIVDVAVRSSATAEDLPDASFAGQQETYLNVHGETQLVEMVKRCFASLFTDRAISYRENIRYDHLDVGLSVGIQQMVRSDLACAGVMFSIDTESGFKDTVLINSSFGLGEAVVQGSVTPDEFVVFKPTLKTGFRPILRKTLGSKEHKIVYDTGGERMTKTMAVSPDDRQSFSLNDDEILRLSKWAILIEEHYSGKRGLPTPMDIEWAKDGITGELFVVQARPETVQAQRQENFLETYRLKVKADALLQGQAIGGRIGQGRTRIIHNVTELDSVEKGDVLVAEKTDPDWEPVMKRVSAIITERGGRTCHAAIVARELGIPAVVGVVDATQILKNGDEVTVSCAQGETGLVYKGKIPFEVEKIDLKSLSRPKTKIMMNVANPAEAFSLSFIPNDGVGLAREEFINTHHVRIHPMALLEFASLKDLDVRRQIEELTKGYPDKAKYFVDRLAEGVSIIAAAFYPKDVIVRFSDLKTNEYAHLIGGSTFEPHEANPMIGFRGASRYYHPLYRRAFALECQAMKKVREEMGLTNVKLMIPFCRTVEEGKMVIQEMAKNGLKRGEHGLEIYVMCEIPSNVIMADQFAQIFDGFSIGSNDLTQMVLGADRDSELLAQVFDERNEAVQAMIAQAIELAHESQRKIGICGQAPSDYPEFAEFLVRSGIDSISLSPDVVLATTKRILEVEARLKTEDQNVMEHVQAEIQ